MSSDRNLNAIVQETAAVVSVMRRNAKWQTSASQFAYENPLLKAFKQMRDDLFAVDDISKMDPLVYLSPFLEVIRSEETTGPITAAALTSVCKFLDFGLLTPETPNVERAMSKLALAVVDCHFDPTHASSDEVVLVKILRTLSAAVLSPCGVVLSDAAVCEILRTCFRMCFQVRLSELLRHCAEQTLVDVVPAVFMRLQFLVESGGYSPTDGKGAASSAEEYVFVDNDGARAGSQEPLSPGLGPREVAPQRVASSGSEKAGFIKSRGVRFERQGDADDADPIPKGYGVPVVCELLRFLCSIIDPGEAGNTLEMRTVGLSLVNTVLEQCDLSVFPEAVLEGVEANLARFLYQILLSPDNVTVLAHALRAVFSLWRTLRGRLKVALECILSTVVRLLKEEQLGSYEQTEVVLEFVVELCRQPAFMSEVFINYDCDLRCENLAESLVKLLSKHAFPVSGRFFTVHLLSLDALIATVKNIAMRCDASMELTPEEAASVDALRSRKAHKKVLLSAVEQFNKKPKNGVAYMQNVGLLPTPLTADAVARFLRDTNGLEKDKIGEYLGDDAEFNQEVLTAYVRTFDFTGMRIDVAFRAFLETFLPPGEAQKIGRIVEAFGIQLYEQSPAYFASADAAFILAFSIIMLNTDQHNDGVKNRMDCAAYMRNVRGQNGGEDFPHDALRKIFEGVSSNEIRLTMSQYGGPMDAKKWGDVLKKTALVERHRGCGKKGREVDREMFSLMWAPTMAALSVVFDVVEDDTVLQRAIDGFYLCAKASASHGLCDVLDSLTASLCKAAALASPAAAALEFGQNLKAQMAAITVFAIARQYGDHLREGWRGILDCILCFYAAGLLPTELVEMDAGFLHPGRSVVLPAPVLAKASSRGSGFLSTFSQYLSLSDPVPDVPDEVQAEAEKNVRDCIVSCKIKEVFSETRFIQAGALVSLAKALVVAAPPPSCQKAGGEGGGLSADEGVAVFCLEKLVDVTLRNRDRAACLWMLVYDHFAAIFSGATRPSFLVHRAVVALTRLTVRLIHKDAVSDRLESALKLLLDLPPPVWAAVAEEVVAGLRQLVLESGGYVQTEDGWETIFALIEGGSEHAPSQSFEALRTVVDQSHVTALNFSPCLRCLQSFVHPTHSVKAVVATLDLLWVTLTRVPTIAADCGEKDLWRFWKPLLRALAPGARDPRREVRLHALALLQRALLMGELEGSDAALLDAFHQVLFPLLVDVLKPFEAVVPTAEVDETRMRAVNLLSKALLHLLPKLAQLDGFLAIWLNVLRFMEEYAKAGASPLLAEMVPETLKNMLLVLLNDGDMGPDGKAQVPNMWDQTWAAIETFLPTLKEEVLRSSEEPAAAEAAAAAAAAAAAVGEAAEGEGDVAAAAKPEAVTGEAAEGDTSGRPSLHVEAAEAAAAAVASPTAARSTGGTTPPPASPPGVARQV